MWSDPCTCYCAGVRNQPLYYRLRICDDQEEKTSPMWQKGQSVTVLNLVIMWRSWTEAAYMNSRSFCQSMSDTLECCFTEALWIPRNLLGHHWKHLCLKAVLILLELCPEQGRISFFLVNNPSDELKLRSPCSCSIYFEIIVHCSHVLHHQRTDLCRLSCTRMKGPDWPDWRPRYEAKVSRWLLLVEKCFHLTSEPSSKFTIIYHTLRLI